MKYRELREENKNKLKIPLFVVNLENQVEEQQKNWQEFNSCHILCLF